MVLGLAGIAVFVAILICQGLVISRAKKSGGINIERWIYGRKGEVSIPKSESTKKKKWLELAVAVISFGLVIGTMNLGMKGYIYNPSWHCIMFYTWSLCGFFLKDRSAAL